MAKWREIDKDHVIKIKPDYVIFYDLDDTELGYVVSEPYKFGKPCYRMNWFFVFILIAKAILTGKKVVTFHGGKFYSHINPANSV